MSNRKTAKNLTISALVFGALGFLMFIYYKTRGINKSSGVNIISKGSVALGVFLLAFAVLELSSGEQYCASYCSTAHDPDSNPWSYKTFCGPPPS